MTKQELEDLGRVLVNANKLGLRHYAPHDRQGNKSAPSDSNNGRAKAEDRRMVRSIKGHEATKRLEARNTDEREDKFNGRG